MIAPERATEVPSFRAPRADDWRDLVAENATDKDQQNEARKSRDELKNMLLTSLQMQHLVVLSGSGCSQSAGGPSMQDLWNGAVGKEPTDKARTTAEKANHDLKDQDIEAFLSRVEAFLQVNQDQLISEFLSSSKQVILDKRSAFLDAGKLGSHKTFLHRLSRRRVRDERCYCEF